MTIAAYKRTISGTEAPRQIERRLLAQATAKLERHQANFDNADDGSAKLAILTSGLRDAVWNNILIWQTLKSDLAQPNNAFPAELKASLISLAIWVERHSQGVLAGSKKVKPLIEINSSVFLGLGGKPMRAVE